MTDEPRVVDAVRQRGFFGGGDPERVDERTLFVPAMANATVLDTDDGILLVDTGVMQVGALIHAAARDFTSSPLDTVVYSHGHIDHVMGLAPWLEEAAARPRVVAHRNVPARFRRYQRLPELNEHINAVQFGFDDVRWPREYVFPDVTYDEALTLRIGGETFELRHGKGETDDGTWVWAPERGVLCTGDFWISCVPNCGNPQKVQRYPEEWVVVLETMAALGAEHLLPGHGPAIHGAAEVSRALSDAAAYLRSIVDQTLDLLRLGLEHDEIVARVEYPVSDAPYLQPVYDRPEFIVRNLIRLHSGWWDGRPANLMPAPASDRAAEIVRLAGGVEEVVARARQLADTDLPLGCHLAEWAATAEPGNADALECVRDLFLLRAEREVSLMGRGIYMHAVRRARRALGEGRSRDE